MSHGSETNPAVTRLTEMGVIRERGLPSQARNQIIGCIGCRLAREADTNPEFTAQDISQCLEISHTQVWQILKQLTRADVFTTRKIAAGSARYVYYQVNDSPAGQALRESVVAIRPCRSLVIDKV